MTDLAPLLLLILGLVYDAIVIVLARTRRLTRHPRAQTGTFLLSLILVAAPYLAYWWGNGDPDVWDFYRSWWALPVILLGGMSVVLYVTTGHWPRSKSVVTR